LTIHDFRQQLIALTDALQFVESQLTSLSEPPAAVPVAAEYPPTSAPSATRRFRPSIWPRVGGLGRLPPTSDLFGLAAFRDAYKPGLLREIYAGACFGLRRLSATLQVPLQKVSTCSSGRLVERMRELGADEYASQYLKDGRQIVDRDGFHNWFPAHLHTSVRPAPSSPVRVAARSLTVTLPATMAAADFDRAFDAEVRKASIADWIATPEGQRHCADRGIDPAVARRVTPYRYGAATRHCPAVELVVFRTRNDADRLISLAERVVLQHLGLFA
jgi:hypothetical protein